MVSLNVNVFLEDVVLRYDSKEIIDCEKLEKLFYKLEKYGFNYYSIKNKYSIEFFMSKKIKDGVLINTLDDFIVFSPKEVSNFFKLLLKNYIVDESIIFKDDRGEN
jgi:hypothetical protein